MRKVLFIFCFCIFNYSIKAQDITNGILLDALIGHNLYKADMTAQDYNTAGMYFYNRKM